MGYNTEIFNEEFNKWPIYKRFPQMMPFVGSEYPNMKTKLLVIGESFYLPSGCSIHLDDSKWYHSDMDNDDLENEIPDNINEEPQFWIDTVRPINDGRYQKYSSKSGTIY